MDEFPENLSESGSDENSEVAKYCSECLTIQNLTQMQALQAEIDLKFHQARRNCQKCQFKVSDRIRTAYILATRVGYTSYSSSRGEFGAEEVILILSWVLITLPCSNDLF